MPFISFSYVIIPASTSSTMSNRSGESGHTFLAWDLSGEAFSFSSLIMMFVMGFSQVSFIMVRKFLSIPKLLRIFNQERMWGFVECFFFKCKWDDHAVFIFHFVHVMYHIDWLAYIKPDLHARYKSNVVMMYNLLIFYWIQFANILLRIFCISVHQRVWPVVFFSCDVFVLFRYQRDVDFIKCV